jgi:hypothetical protein
MMTCMKSPTVAMPRDPRLRGSCQPLKTSRLVVVPATLRTIIRKRMWLINPSNGRRAHLKQGKQHCLTDGGNV